MKNIFAMVLLVFTLNARSGNERGNGGDVIVCKNAQGETVSSEILDVYEAKEMRQIFIQLGDASLLLEEKLKVLTDRLSIISPTFAKFIASEYELFWKEARFLDNIVLNDVPDSDHLYIPKGCAIEQIAIQRKPEFDEDKRFVISNDLWKKLNNDNKLSLIIHEIIFKIAIDNGHTDSRKVRYLNSLLLSENILNYKGIKFPEMISKLNINHKSITYFYQGYEFKASEYSIGSSTIGGELITPTTLDIHSNPIDVIIVWFYREGFGVGPSFIQMAPNRAQKFELRDGEGKVIINANVCQYMNFRSDGSLQNIFGCDLPGNESHAVVNWQTIKFNGHLALSQDGYIVEYIHATSPFMYEFFGNNIPFAGNLTFEGGVLTTHNLYTFNDHVMDVLGVKFKISSNSMVQNDLMGNLNFVEFVGHTELIKLPVQKDTFQCSQPISFYSNGSLKTCSRLFRIGGVLLLRGDGTQERLNNGTTVLFDMEGYLLNHEFGYGH